MVVDKTRNYGTSSQVKSFRTFICHGQNLISTPYCQDSLSANGYCLNN